MSPEASAIILLFFCVAIVVIVILSIIIYKKNKIIKQKHELLNTTLTEREQNLISNYRELNNNGKSIVDTECKNLTDNGATRKFEDDGI